MTTFTNIAIFFPSKKKSTHQNGVLRTRKKRYKKNVDECYPSEGEEAANRSTGEGCFFVVSACVPEAFGLSTNFTFFLGGIV